MSAEAYAALRLAMDVMVGPATRKAAPFHFVTSGAVLNEYAEMLGRDDRYDPSKLYLVGGGEILDVSDGE